MRRWSQDHLIPCMEIHSTIYVLQNRAPCHASNRIKNFLVDKAFQVFDWLGNSPDLNPNENCWNCIKEKLKDKDTGSVNKVIRMLWVKDMR
jgi:hypothetical protein